MLRRIREYFRRDSREEALPVPSTLVVGLGNPGTKYARTRHSIGFRVVQSLAERHGGVWREDRASQSMLSVVEFAGRTVALMAPQTFMNCSGESVLAALDRWSTLDPTTDLIIVYDDLDLPTGRIRLRPDGGAGGHNGIGDILERLGSKSVARLRFGIGHPGAAGAVIDWVLEPFSGDEEQNILPSAIDWAADGIEAAIEEGVRPAMGRFNAVRIE
jgi:PTH1 family peptidyl-tRNA hydrolase